MIATGGEGGEKFNLKIFLPGELNPGLQRERQHTGCLDPKKILSTIDAPPGVPGVSKNHIFFSTNEIVFLLR